MRTILVTWTVYLLCHINSGWSAEVPAKELPIPGEVFLVSGRTAFVIPATNHLSQKFKPWVWYCPTLPGLPGNEEKWMFEQFLNDGISIAGIDVGESYGSPAGRKFFSALYSEMTRSRGFSPKPLLLGRSRGGLMALSWAADNPHKVSGFAGIYPVCNIKSYPGVDKAAAAYELTPEQLLVRLSQHNPIDRLEPLAEAGVPLFAIHGDVDTVVPLEMNSGLVKNRYEALGGSMDLVVPKGQGHNMWPGFFQSEELVHFVKANANPPLTVYSPREYQVIQRSSKKKGTIPISGLWKLQSSTPVVLEARVRIHAKAGRWRELAKLSSPGNFEGEFEAPAGGWHRLELRARAGKQILAQSTIHHVGIGEVFVVAGQSNSANYGEEKQPTRTGLVVSFDGQVWQLANDPQPGAGGEGGSFMPPFGDAIAESFKVPVGIVACGIGATSIREWLPQGSKFPNPPTLTANVQRLPGGEWESTGSIYAAFSQRLNALGPHGFRAILWHQGESDANQADSTRTLPGNLYREYLALLISSIHRDIGWAAPWFVAQASYHTPDDPGSAEIRAAQESLWKDGIALEGPDTDLLKSEFRDSGGQGVHFNGAGLRQHAAMWVDKVSPWLKKQLK